MRHLRRGATLMEVLLAFTLTALVVILVLNIFPSAMATVARAEQRQVAGNLAESLLERKAALPFDQVPVGLVEDGGTDYRTHLEVGPVGSEDPLFLRQVTVTVTWSAKGRVLQLQRALWIHRLGNRI